MRKEKGNVFGKKLEMLLLTANVKNYAVASELNYDVSYISKWITGKALPSRKNIEKVITGVSNVLMNQGSKDGVEILSQQFGVKNEALRQAIKKMLRDAYFEVTGEYSDNKYINNAFFEAAPRQSYSLINEYAASLSKEKPVDIAVMVDIFALDRKSKLKMAGMNNNTFGIKEQRYDYKINYIIDITNLKGTSIYDVILLVHMMTGFSLTDYSLYYSDLASGKVVVSVKEEFATVSLLGNNKQLFCTASTKDKKSVEEVYEGIMSVVDTEKSIFSSIDMKEVLISHEYLQSLLTNNSRWLIGHMTEHFVSPELFYELSDEYFGKDNELASEVERAYLIGLDAIRRNCVKMMIYNRAIVDYVFSGELDFFNNQVILTPQQRERELIYLKKLFNDIADGKIKIIRDGFSDDFKYITNPCIFLSDSLDYLRLENKLFSNNLMLVEDKKMRRIFDEFYEEIWRIDEELVIADHCEIMRKIEGFLDNAVYLAKGEYEW